MENPNKIKRSIRIPKEMNEVLEELSEELGRSVNSIILQIIEERIME